MPFYKSCDIDKFLEVNDNQRINLLITFLKHLLLILVSAF